MDVFYDNTVNDIIIHDIGNSTWNSIVNVYGTFENSFLLIVSINSKILTLLFRINLFVLRKNQIL